MFNNVNLLAIFTTGLLTGGLTCMAVQGGLLTATLAQREEEHLQEHMARSGKVLPILSFLIAKLITYTILGAFLGWLGEVLQLSLSTRVILQIFVSIFMVGTALNMLRAHPIFRYFVIQPPRFLTRIVRNQSKRRDVFAPALLGAFTIFIPCGTTQAMMALAIGTANPILGAAVLFAFVLGTSPVFFLLGYLTMKLGDVLHERFVKFVAAVIIILAIYTLNSAIALTGSFWTLENLFHDFYCVVSYCDDSTDLIADSRLAPVTEETITIGQNGYIPNTFAVKAGSEVTVHLKNQGAGGCIQAFTIPALNIQKIVPPNTSGTITFIAPASPGRISFMCSMGMYPGTIEII
jgi:sulfite exporter TauE/SafE